MSTASLDNATTAKKKAKNTGDDLLSSSSMAMGDDLPVLSSEELKRQKIGWMSMIFFLLLFPILFFGCVFFPMWVGWIIPFP